MEMKVNVWLWKITPFLLPQTAKKKERKKKVLPINWNPKAEWILRKLQNNPEVNWKPTSCCLSEPVGEDMGEKYFFLPLLVPRPPHDLLAGDAISMQQTSWKRKGRDSDAVGGALLRSVRLDVDLKATTRLLQDGSRQTCVILSSVEIIWNLLVKRHNSCGSVCRLTPCSIPKPRQAFKT